jgi:hypothetical protein
MGRLLVVGLIALTAASASAVANPCAAGKDKCVSKKVGAIFKCYSKADNPGVTAAVLAACIQAAKDKFDGGADPTKGCFAKLEGKFAGSCLTTNDVAPLETTVDSFTQDAYCALHPAAASCIPCQATTGGFCWFLGSEGADCDSTCAAVGRVYDPATKAYAGSDGTDANCQNVLDALLMTAVGPIVDISAGGFGCCVPYDGARDTDPTLSGISKPGLNRVCACQ